MTPVRPSASTARSVTNPSNSICQSSTGALAATSQARNCVVVFCVAASDPAGEVDGGLAAKMTLPLSAVNHGTTFGGTAPRTSLATSCDV